MPLNSLGLRVAAACVVGLAVLSTAAIAADDAGVPGNSTLAGTIVSDSKKKVSGATVLAYQLSTAQVFRSAPTGEKGHYEIAGLSHGYYDIAVETNSDLFVGNQVINVPAQGNAVASFSLTTSDVIGTGPRDFPGSDRAPTGFATLVTQNFWMTGKGIAIWAGGGLATVILIVAGTRSSSGNAATQTVP